MSVFVPVHDVVTEDSMMLRKLRGNLNSSFSSHSIERRTLACSSLFMTLSWLSFYVIWLIPLITYSYVARRKNTDIDGTNYP